MLLTYAKWICKIKKTNYGGVLKVLRRPRRNGTESDPAWLGAARGGANATTSPNPKKRPRFSRMGKSTRGLRVMGSATMALMDERAVTGGNQRAKRAMKRLLPLVSLMSYAEHNGGESVLRRIRVPKLLRMQ